MNPMPIRWGHTEERPEWLQPQMKDSEKRTEEKNKRELKGTPLEGVLEVLRLFLMSFQLKATGNGKPECQGWRKLSDGSHPAGCWGPPGVQVALREVPAEPCPGTVFAAP